MPDNFEPLRKHEIPGRVAVAEGGGGLPKIMATAKSSTAEIYLLGAHVTGFQKNGEPPLLFMSAQKLVCAGQADPRRRAGLFSVVRRARRRAGARLRAHRGLGTRENFRRAGRRGDFAFAPAGNSRTRRLEKLCARNLS